MKAIILAAGQGKRLHSEQFQLPKVLRRANGLPLVRHVLNAIDFIPAEDTVLVVGFMAEKVEEELGGAFRYALQAERRGTGHAVLCAKEALDGYTGTVLVTCGDMPLLKKETYLSLLSLHQKERNACTVLACENPDNFGYGRIIRDDAGRFAAIVEQKDCTEAQAAVTELNMGVYCFEAGALFDALNKVGNDNAQKEYYLTDVPRILAGEGQAVGVLTIRDVSQGLGVNTEDDLKNVEKVLKER